MNQRMLAAVIGAVLIAGIAMTPLLSVQIASADKTIVNQCKIDKETGKCEFNQTYKSKRGDIKVKNEIDASNIISGGGNSNVSTVDQEARNDISDLRTDLDSVNKTVSFNWNMTDQRLGQLADLSNIQNGPDGINANQSKFNQNVTTQLFELRQLVESAITDITNDSGPVIPPVTNDTGPVVNDTGPVIPPVTNDTGPVVNDTGPVIPPVDNQTSGNDTGPIVVPPTNESGPITNSTPIDNGSGTDFENFTQ